MKMSKIFKPLTSIIFWWIFAWSVHTIYPGGKSAYQPLIVMFIVWSLCQIIRMKAPKVLNVFLHITMLGVVGSIQFFFDAMTMPVLILMIFHVIMSFAARTSGLQFMDKGTGGHLTVVILLYFVTFVIGRTDMLIFYFAFVTFFVLQFIQNVIIKNEEHIDIISEYSVMDVHDVRYNSNRMTLITGAIIAVVCTGLGFLGRLEILKSLMNKIKSGVLGFLNKVGIDTSYSEPIAGPPPSGDVPPPTFGEPEVTNHHPAWTVVGIVLTILILIYIVDSIIRLIIRSRKNRVYMPDLGKEEDIVKRKKEAKERKLRAIDMGNRKSIRRMYRNSVLKGRGKRNDDLVSKTPYEHRAKRQSEGVEISKDFVNMYEKARYGNETITKADVKNMHNLR